ncbi:MAG: serine O-acetyltransferase [Gammaproteobacteria bacterium 28-57-27]|nr:MAG: serine O-acetyltransferase [Gammaproteobacteria bacterium 28-57-27]
MENEAVTSTAPRVKKFGLWSLLREDVECVFARDPAARTRIEVLLTYPGVHAVMLHRLSHGMWRRGWRLPARMLGSLTRFFTNVDIHPGAAIGRRLFIDHGAGVVIGETAVLGNDVTLYHGVTLGGTSWRKGRRHPQLGDGVLVGAGAKVLGPIMLGTRVRVGANSVVVKDVPADRTVIGIPGRIVRTERESTSPDGINLDHHLIPDPVGKALSCLLDRVKVLESRLQAAGLEPFEVPCGVCDGQGECAADSMESPVSAPVQSKSRKEAA